MTAVALRVESIEFRPPDAATPTALLTRNNAADPPSSLWSRETDRPLCYAIGDWQRSDALELDVTFRASASERAAVYISAASDALFGASPACRLDVPEGSNLVGPVRLTFAGVTLGTAAIGRHVVTVHWIMCDRPDVVPIAHEFDCTVHHVLTILGRPQRPWTQPGRHQHGNIPWIEALDWACRWASGAKDAQTASRLVTERINQLGGIGVTSYGQSSCFKYSGTPEFCPGPGYFDLTAFLTVLSGETASAPARANCADLAAAVTTFANILGCNLQTILLGIESCARKFGINDVRLLGLTPKENLAYVRGGFAYHRAAVSQPPLHVHDATLQVDIDPRPNVASWVPVGDMPLVRGGQDNDYLDRLVDPRSRCEVRWDVLAPPLVCPPDDPPVERCEVSQYEAYLALLLSAERTSSPAPLDASLPPAGWSSALVQRDHWHSLRQGMLPRSRYALTGSRNAAVALLIDVVECGTPGSASSVLAEIAASSSLPFEMMSEGLALLDSAARCLALRRGASVVKAMSTGSEPADLVAFASALGSA